MPVELSVDADRITLTHTLHVLVLDYWHDVNVNAGRNAADYFVPDGRWEGDEFSLGTNREDIRYVYARGERQGGAPGFHAVANCRAWFDAAPDRARCSYVLIEHRSDTEDAGDGGRSEHLERVDERWQLTEEGWRIAHRSTRAVFPRR